MDRHGKKGSPVVPGSLQKVMEDGESVLYTVTVLRSMYEVSSKTLFVCNDVSYGMPLSFPRFDGICSQQLLLYNLIDSFLLRYTHILLTCYSTQNIINHYLLPHPRPDTTKAMNSSQAHKSISSRPSRKSCVRNDTWFGRTLRTTQPNRARRQWYSNNSK